MKGGVDEPKFQLHMLLSLCKDLLASSILSQPLGSIDMEQVQNMLYDSLEQAQDAKIDWKQIALLEDLTKQFANTPMDFYNVMEGTDPKKLLEPLLQLTMDAIAEPRICLVVFYNGKRWRKSFVIAGCEDTQYFVFDPIKVPHVTKSLEMDARDVLEAAYLSTDTRWRAIFISTTATKDENTQ